MSLHLTLLGRPTDGTTKEWAMTQGGAWSAECHLFLSWFAQYNLVLLCRWLLSHSLHLLLLFLCSLHSCWCSVLHLILQDPSPWVSVTIHDSLPWLQKPLKQSLNANHSYLCISPSFRPLFDCLLEIPTRLSNEDLRCHISHPERSPFLWEPGLP